MGNGDSELEFTFWDLNCELGISNQGLGRRNFGDCESDQELELRIRNEDQ